MQKRKYAILLTQNRTLFDTGVYINNITSLVRFSLSSHSFHLLNSPPYLKSRDFCFYNNLHVIENNC